MLTLPLALMLQAPGRICGRSPRRLHAERLLRSPRPLALSRARDKLSQAFTGEVLGACVTRVLLSVHLVVLQAPVGGDLLHTKMSHSDMTQFAVCLRGHCCQCCRRVHHDGRRHGTPTDDINCSIPLHCP